LTVTAERAHLKVLFIEPPKNSWFVMGEYIPPPFGILVLASYLEAQNKDCDIDVIDCQAEKLDWKSLERRIESLAPDVVAPSGLGTCNAYKVLRTVEITKKVDPNITTVVGGQHFTALAEESLREYPEIDIVVRGEGEETLSNLLNALNEDRPLSTVKGISFRHKGHVIHNPDRPLLDDLNALPLPGYHFIQEHMKTYYFTLMTGKSTPFAIIEGSRGCQHNCTYCSQWRFWEQTHRPKSPKRIADEFEHLHRKYGSKFIWLTDDNFGLGKRIEQLCEEILDRGLSDDLSWFVQARCDDIIRNKALLPKMRQAGAIWMLAGFESANPATLDKFHRKGVTKTEAKEAVNLLKKNEIICQATFIIGERGDSHESIESLRKYVDWLDPDLATFMCLTPFPGTEIYETAKRNNWIEDKNWNNYDMIHAIMPTEHLTREQVQKELYECYRNFFGSWSRQCKGLFSKNPIMKRTYQYLARRAILTNLRNLF
jgi:anaerobic magnesium-protoporphyrin IX monomethyl ester cyclase